MVDEDMTRFKCTFCLVIEKNSDVNKVKTEGPINLIDSNKVYKWGNISMLSPFTVTVV